MKAGTIFHDSKISCWIIHKTHWPYVDVSQHCRGLMQHKHSVLSYMWGVILPCITCGNSYSGKMRSLYHLHTLFDIWLPSWNNSICCMSLYSYKFVIWPDCLMGHPCPGGICPESVPLSLTCSITTMLGNLLMIDTYHIYVFTSIFFRRSVPGRYVSLFC